MSKKGISPRLALVVIAALFIVPLVAAWLMYAGVIDYSPAKTRNLGTLVRPPVPISLNGLSLAGSAEKAPEDLEDHWIVLYAVPEPCDTACIEAVTSLRQVHRAAGRNQSRIRLLAASDGDFDSGQLESIYPAIFVANIQDGGLAAALRDVAAVNGGQVENSVYLIDPLGNIMLFYAAGFDPNDLKKDLKRLLTWSKLDEN